MSALRDGNIFVTFDSTSKGSTLLVVTTLADSRFEWLAIIPCSNLQTAKDSFLRLWPFKSSELNRRIYVEKCSLGRSFCELLACTRGIEAFLI